MKTPSPRSTSASRSAPRPWAGISRLDGRTRTWLLLILAVGALLRGLYLGELSHSPDYAVPWEDADYHNYWARALAFGDWSPPAGEPDPAIRTSPYFRAPGYSYVLAAFYRVTGPGWTAVRVIQMAIGLGTVILAFGLALGWMGELVALLFAVMLATYWGSYYYEAEFLDASLSSSLLVGLIVLLWRWRGRPGAASSIGLGLLLGFAAVVRPNFLALAPAMLLWLLWSLRGDARAWRAWLSPISLVALGLGLALLPSTIRNYQVAHAFIPISTNAGINLYLGNNPKAEGLVVGTTEVGNFDNCYEWPKLVAGVSRKVGHPVDHVEASRWFSARAREYIAAHPGEALGLAFKKLLLFLGPVEPTDNRIIQGDRAAYALLRWNPWSFALALSLAIAGAACLVAGRRSLSRSSLELAALIGLLFAFWVASFLPFAVTARYRAPVVPLLLLFAAYFVARLIECARARDWRRAATWSAVWLVLLAAASVNLAGAEPSLAHWHYQRGLVYSRLGQKAEAEGEMRQALALNPKYAAVMVDLGALLASRGRVAEALPLFEQALPARSGDPVLLGNLAGAYELLGRRADAHAAYQRLLALEPNSRKANDGMVRTAGSPEP